VLLLKRDRSGISDVGPAIMALDIDPQFLNSEGYFFFAALYPLGRHQVLAELFSEEVAELRFKLRARSEAQYMHTNEASLHKLELNLLLYFREEISKESGDHFLLADEGVLPDQLLERVEFLELLNLNCNLSISLLALVLIEASQISRGSLYQSKDGWVFSLAEGSQAAVAARAVDQALLFFVFCFSSDNALDDDIDMLLQIAVV